MILQTKNVKELFFFLFLALLAIFNNVTVTGVYSFYLLWPVLRESGLNFKGFYVLLVCSVQFMLGVWALLFMLSIWVRSKYESLLLFSIFSLLISSIYLSLNYLGHFNLSGYEVVYSDLEFCAYISVVLSSIIMVYLLMKRLDQ